MKRIAVSGTTGSGKSTLGAALAEKTGCPFLDLDEFNWLPGWKQREEAEFVGIIDEKTRGETWVSAGNYKVVREMIYARADTVVWLDYPAPLVFWRLLKRSVSRAWTKKTVCNGNTESFYKLFFSKESLLLWFFKSHWRRQREMTERMENRERYAHATFIRLKSPKETQKWLNSISSRP